MVKYCTGVQCCEWGVGDAVTSFIVASSWESAVGREEYGQKEAERSRTRTNTPDAGFMVLKVQLGLLRLLESIRPLSSHLPI